MTLSEIKSFLKDNAFPYYKNLEKREMERENGKDSNPLPEMEEGWRDGIFRGFLHSISMEDLTELKSWMEHSHGCPERLYYKACGILKSRLRSQIAEIPTPTLLRWYEDKKSGKVVFSRKALMDRFIHQDEEVKRTILKAFLKGGIKEMEWAARYLRARWTKSMTTLVEVCWKKTQNPVLAQVILRHIPDSFVLGEQERLAEATDYSYVCARLCDHKDFHVDPSRLTTPEYLYVLAKSKNAHVDPVFIDTLLDEYLATPDHVYSRDVGLILWALGKLGLADTIIRITPHIEKHYRNEQ